MAEDTPTVKLRIPGTEIAEPLPQVPAEAAGQIQIEEMRTFQISAARAGTPEAPVIRSLPDDVVEVELEGGIRFWTSQERLRTEVFGLAGARAGEEALDLPAGIAGHSPTRGLVGRALIKTLRFFKIAAAQNAARFLAQRLENHLLGRSESDRGPGLYRVMPGDDLVLEPIGEALVNLPPDRPSLLFLHGTASSTTGSFGKLWTDRRRAERHQLLAPYEGRVFGLEHETLTRSPIDNAIDVAGRLPAGARLHLVSHSRGGLVGELLSRAGMEGGRDPFDADDLSFFAEHNPDKVRGDLEHLNAILKEKRFRIERFVRVACPARGTTLASERFDLYLSVIFNLLGTYGFIAKLAGGVITSLFSELIMVVAKQRSDPSVLPGIEAMIPSSPLVALINRATTPVAGELRVIAGDMEGESILSTIGTLLTDPLFQGDHDLVVDTDAMFGGAERSGGAGFLFRRGGDVHHFSYFENADSAEGLARTLSRGGREPDGFEPFSVRAADSGMPPYEKRDLADGAPVVFVLPGIMGSHLAIDKNRIWLDPLDIARGKFHLLSFGTPNLVRPDAPLWLFYGALIRHLSRTHRVEPFPFDWRLSVFDEGERLAEAISKALDGAEKHRQPVSIVAHSMGGLVARAMIATRPEVWERMKEHPEARLIMLGTPNGGSHAVTRVLTGRDSLIRKLALLDTRRRRRELIGIVAQFPGVLEMLPEGSSLDLFDESVWQELADADPDKQTWQAPAEAALQAARASRERLAQAPIDSKRLLYIAGCAPATPVDLQVEGVDGKKRLVFYATSRGDGRVPWATGIPEGVKTWYLQAAHGDLARAEEGFDAITELLRTGTTGRLPTVPPEVRGALDHFELPTERETLYPDFTDLACTAMGAGRTRRARHTERQVRVSVRHGDLAFAGHPVMVGHYKGDTIISAEAYLDRTLDGRLSARHQLGLYPGELGTAEVFLNPDWEQSRRTDGKPPGAIVVGLGEVGKLSPGALQRAVSRGVRSYALLRAECPEALLAKAASSGISALLVGTGAGGVAVQDAVTAILRGIVDANRAIAESGRSGCTPIEEVEFVELFEDRAIQTAHTLARLRNDPDISRVFAIDREPVIVPLEGGMRRASFVEEDPWWQRLQVKEDKQERLSFDLLTDRARAEVYLQQSQRSLADRFIEEMCSTTASSEGVAVTLFEMLVPNELKEYAPERRDVVLVLNEAAARYPWEMMQERRMGADAPEERKPLAVQAGMVRQLLVEKFRERVVTARETTALVIGNPTTEFSDLPAAEREAREVQKALESYGYKVTPLIGSKATGPEVLKQLFARDYQIVHLAGHGVFEHHMPVSCDSCHQKIEGQPVTGMVIGPNQYLTAAQIRQMRSVPQLVFVNCCHLGKIDDRKPPRNVPPHLAANLAAELIRMGVRGVVAAGWAVQDDAAALFADIFYREMLSGSTFGQAALAARAATFSAHPQVNTWGAYQCYGDPDFRLRKGGAIPMTRSRERVYTALSEVILDLENIAAAAKTARGPAAGEHLKTIRDIEQTVPPAWLASSEVQAALGRAYGELKQFPEAIACYRRAISDEKALASIRDAEQLWNLQSRWALQLAASEPKRALELFAEAQQGLLQLNTAFGESVERLSLLGSVAKRWIMIAAEVAGKREALEAMAGHYGRAYELGAARGRPAFYPLVNQLTAQVLAQVIDGRSEPGVDFDASLNQALELAEEECRRRRDFWNTVAPVDCSLLRHLSRQELPAHTDEIMTGYAKAKNVGSPREFQSVLDQLDFLQQVIAAAPKRESRQRILKALQTIRQGVEAAGAADGPREVEPPRVMSEPPPPPEPPEPGSTGARDTRGATGTDPEARPRTRSKPSKTLMPKMSGTLPKAEEELQPVLLGASAPRQAKPGAEFTARFAAYEKALEEEVRDLLTKLSPSAETVLGIQECRWKRGTLVTVKLSGRGLVVDPPEQTFTWQGNKSILDFDVAVPGDAEEGTIPLKFDVAIEGIIVARLRLELEITASPRKKGQAATTGEPAKSAFASYSSKDRMRVLDRVDAIKIAAGLDVFQDCLDLNPGEQWKPRLDKEIRQRDLFLLFWSKNASESKWVVWELDTAMKEKGEEALQLHPLDPGVKPPPGLEQLHIGSNAMWVRKGYEAVEKERHG